MSTELSKIPELSAFAGTVEFEHGQRVAKMLSSSSLVPEKYQGNIQNTMIALELATRMGISPIMVMQNLDIVKGKPSWSSSFIIAAINNCGKFSPLRFEITGTGMEMSCYAYCKDLETGMIIKGATVTMQMAKAEGWLDKAGSKWKTMPEQMIMYRAGAFFGRVYVPEIMMGMHTVDEISDSEIKVTGMISEIQKDKIIDLVNNDVFPQKERDPVLSKIDGMTAGQAEECIRFLTNEIEAREQLLKQQNQ